MGFQYQVINNVPTITQTGTDTDLTGLIGLTGVSVIIPRSIRFLNI